jgi:hypothetical protein
MYQKIEQQQEQEKKWRWVRHLTQSATGWVSLLIWLGVLAVLGVVAFFLIRFLINWLGHKVEGLDKKSDEPVPTSLVYPADKFLAAGLLDPEPDLG